MAGPTIPITSILPDEGWAPLLGIIVRECPAASVIEVNTPGMAALAVRMLVEVGRQDVTAALCPPRGRAPAHGVGPMGRPVERPCAGCAANGRAGKCVRLCASAVTVAPGCVTRSECCECPPLWARVERVTGTIHPNALVVIGLLRHWGGSSQRSMRICVVDDCDAGLAECCADRRASPSANGDGRAG